MNRHLREEDICRWVAGDRIHETTEHLRNCVQCRSHITRMSEVLGEFHDSVRDRSERRLAGYGTFPMGVSGAIDAARGWIPLSWDKLPLTAVALFLALATWFPWHVSRTTHPPAHVLNAPAEGKATLDPDADSALLIRVNAAVSRIVPGALEPLAASIEWKPESKQGMTAGQE